MPSMAHEAIVDLLTTRPSLATRPVTLPGPGANAVVPIRSSYSRPNPTGAIGRDPKGEVFIREDLCTGCGNCAKGCPLDNIQMAPRGGMPGLLDGLLATPKGPQKTRAAAPGTTIEIIAELTR